jgi:hypothetical protein
MKLLATLLALLAACWATNEPAKPVVAPPPPVAKQPPPPVVPLGKQVAVQLITVDQLRAITNYPDTLDVEPQKDATDTYDAVHFKAVGKPERFDFMVRVWSLRGAEADAKFAELVKDLPNAKASIGDRVLGDRAITAFEDNIYGFAWLDKRGAVVLLSCGMGQCDSIEMLIKIANRIASRMR